jgi:homoserine dehydrogenase
MKTYRMALIGFGNVGQGFTQIVAEKGEEMARQFGMEIRIVAVSDFQKGSLYDPDGLDPNALLQAVSDGRNLETIDAPNHGWDPFKTIKESNADVVAEMTYTNLQTAEPASGHIAAALKAGKHVVTTNKGPVALKYDELSRLAMQNKVHLGVEGTVMSGTPSLHLGLDFLKASGIHKVQGILNGTTNYILTRMGEGAGYQEALEQAQRLGYAEADPTGDVEGFDAAGKVVIMAHILMGTPLGMDDVDRKGISHLTIEDIEEARAAGQKWKLIGTLAHEGDEVKASVKPMRLPLSHPLASVDGATNAITYSTELLGDVTLVGPGAGRLETGYALFVDLIAMHNRLHE